MSIKINRQSDLNVGTAGHVDHGKCISPGSKVYTIDHGFREASWLWYRFRGEPVFDNGYESLYSLNILVASVNLDSGCIEAVNPLIYRQYYNGILYRIITSKGYDIMVSPRHPLPILDNHRYRWVMALDVKPGDNLMVIDGCLRNDTIEDIRAINYRGYIYDLYTPPNHTFIGGGGLILHNTTIIEGLTGIWTSSHSEELKRGITIRIGYADMPIYRLHGPKGEIYWSRPEYGEYGEPELLRIISFVDCPGHESLMANMLSGAAVMDGAMLVIAANEDVPRPQTKEHTMALQILGVKNVVVVQNKIDLVSRSEAIENYRKIRDFLSTTQYADSPIIPVSAIHRINLPYLVEALYKYIPVPKRDLSKPFLMYVIRSFDINKPGTPIEKLAGGVIGGSIIQGRVRVGDEIEILPGYLYKSNGKIEYTPLYSEVLDIRTRYARLKEAYGGGLIGIQTDLDPSLTKSDSLVGAVVGEPGTLPPVVYDIDLEVSLFKYVVGTDETIEVRPLTRGEMLRLNIGPAVTLGVVREISREYVGVRLIRPIVADTGWRAAISYRVNNLWRLVGVGIIK